MLHAILEDCKQQLSFFEYPHKDRGFRYNPNQNGGYYHIEGVDLNLKMSKLYVQQTTVCQLVLDRAVNKEKVLKMFHIKEGRSMRYVDAYMLARKELVATARTPIWSTW